MQVKFNIQESPGKGKGVFAGEPIKQGQIVWKYDDNNVREFEKKEEFQSFLEQLPINEAKEYISHCYTFKGKVIYCLEVGIFFNHSSNANVRIPEPDDGNTIAARDIEEGEELCEDYLDFHELAWFQEIAQEYQVQDCISFAKQLKEESPQQQIQNV